MEKRERVPKDIETTEWMKALATAGSVVALLSTLGCAMVPPVPVTMKVPSPDTPAMITMPDGRVVRNIPYSGAFGPSDPPIPPVARIQLPEALSSAERGTLDVWYQRPSPKGPPPIPVAQPKAIYAVGKGPVVQILPGPTPFQDKLPDQLKTASPRDIQYSDNTRVLPRGEIRFVAVDRTANDTKLSLDSMQVEISLTDHEGNEWRVEQVTLAPISNRNVIEPWLGGVAIDTPFHGHSGIASPALPLVRCMMCSYGWADVYKNGERVASSALLHIMLTTDTRDDNNNFAYSSYDSTKNPIRQIHIDLHPLNHLPSPGGFLHVTWENSDWQVGSPEEIQAIAPKIGDGPEVPTITLAAVPYLRWDQQEIHLKAGQKYRLLVSNDDPVSIHQFHVHDEPTAAGHRAHGAGARHSETMTAGRIGKLWKPGDPDQMGGHKHGNTKGHKHGEAEAPHKNFFPLPEGSTWATFVKFDKPGEYEYMCPVMNHARRGMRGKFIVTAEGSAK
jgi:uncharacterized cupredoxin-like copper-binding protein